jgi:hypothetical protein
MRVTAVVGGLGVYGVGVYAAYRYSALNSGTCSCKQTQSVTEGDRMKAYDTLAPTYDKGQFNTSLSATPLEMAYLPLSIGQKYRRTRF